MCRIHRQTGQNVSGFARVCPFRAPQHFVCDGAHIGVVVWLHDPRGSHVGDDGKQYHRQGYDGDGAGNGGAVRACACS